MPDDITLYFNPQCSKCRLTLELLENAGQQPHIVEYLSSPPDAATLEAILAMLGLEPRELMRTFEKEYTQAGLDNPGLSRAELIDAMISYPRLLQRPIVVNNGKAAIGRPPEKVLDIL
ncbi:MAG: arsenate reductase (glutaredoxin) [Gammaproteobacteria bacterium]|jgi:arsenate reductase